MHERQIHENQPARTAEFPQNVVADLRHVASVMIVTLAPWEYRSNST